MMNLLALLIFVCTIVIVTILIWSMVAIHSRIDDEVERKHNK